LIVSCDKSAIDIPRNLIKTLTNSEKKKEYWELK
jgi:hypothetical protein